MEVEVRPVAAMSSSAGMGLGDCGGYFTEADLAAADQLVQLSTSREAVAASPTASTSSSLSVNKYSAEAPAADAIVVDGGSSPWLDRRARKRYRLVAELYHATRPVNGAGKRRSSEQITTAGRREREISFNAVQLAGLSCTY